MPACAPVQPVVPVVPAVPLATCPQPLAVVAQPIPQPAPPVCSTPQRPPAVKQPCAEVPRGPLLTVTPKEIVAPVCSDVIVAAGLCDERGYLLTGQPLNHLEQLVVSHHFMTERVRDRMAEALPGIVVGLEDVEGEDDPDGSEGWRYVEVAE